VSARLLRVVLTAALFLAAFAMTPAAEAAAASPLRDLAAARGITVGTAVNATALAQNSAYRDRLGAEFNSVTPEDAMKWAVVEPVRGQYNWQQADQIVDFAVQHGQTIRGHTLVWHTSLPAWLEQGSFTTDELRAILKTHIETVMTRYAGRVSAWDVVNEAFDENGTLRESLWKQRLGSGYLADAFRWARAADPSAKLYLNEYGVEPLAAKGNAMYALVRELRAQGAPIDGVGVQTHVMVSDQLSQLTRALRRFADLGVDVAITELDVRMPLPSDAVKLAAQAQVYGRAVAACLAVARCRSVSVWGFTDAYSWIPAAIPGWGAADLFDAQLNPKPAYQTVHDTLASWQPPTGQPAGWWWLDDPAGPVAYDATAAGRAATLAGGATLGGDGRVPGISAYTGSGGAEASTATDVIDTTGSFTVSAWVRLTDRSEARVIASQNAPGISSFYLMYQQYSDRWEFTVPSAVQQPIWQTAQSTSVPRLGVWTHLTGVYDASANQLRLYVGGRLEGIRNNTTALQGNRGPWRIGRSWSGAHFAGNISDLRAWPRALGAAEVGTVADRRVGHWPMDSTTGDSSPLGRDAIQSNTGVSWTAGRGGQPRTALALDGTGTLDTTGPIVYTHQSYTVAAWVKLTNTTGYRVAVSQNGGNRAAFYLEYHPMWNRWAFIVPAEDVDEDNWQTVLSTAPPAVGVWTQLVGVFDATTRQLRLYVNGVRQGIWTEAKSWKSEKPLAIGHARGESRFVGAIDDVRVWAEALTDAEVAAL